MSKRTAPAKTPALTDEEQPREGGSFLRNPDGTLTRIEEPEDEAEGEPAPPPAPPINDAGAAGDSKQEG